MPKILTNFKYNANTPNFERDQVKTIAELGAATIDDYDIGHIVYCLQDSKHYCFKPKPNGDGTYSKHDNTYGYFVIFESGNIKEPTKQKIVFAFCSVPEEGSAPANYPIGFTWDVKSDKILPPETQEGAQWFLNDELEPYVWMSIGTFQSDQPTNPSWSTPVMVTGKDGESGVDSGGTEYIYKRTTVMECPNPKYEVNEDGEEYGRYQDDYVPSGWKDHPVGVDNTNRYEYVSTRTLERGGKGWGDWSLPALWSSYGVWGKDGDGVEYVFMNTKEDETPSRPTYKDGITAEQQQESEVVDYLDTWEDYEWKDNPMSPSSNFPLVWHSIRKRKWKENSNSASNGASTWSGWSDPAIWSRWSKDGAAGEVGQSQFKSYIFKWSKDTPDTPVGGSYNDPIPPENQGWSDGVIANTDVTKRLWCSTAWFESSEDFEPTWSEPQVMADTADFDVEFSSVENLPGNPTDNPENWSNDASESTIWMATRRLSQGTWSNWTIAKIKGERGEDGTSIKVSGSYKTVAEFEAAWKDATGKWIAPTDPSQCYVVVGNLYVWDGDSWEDVGPFKGEDGQPGTSAYLHIKYANKVSAATENTFEVTIGGAKVNLELTSDNGEDPGDYIGTFADEISVDPGPSDGRFSKYNWKYWKGEDGYGYEYIYIRTKNATAPNVSNLTSENKDDYVPDTTSNPDWTDNPTGVSADYPFEWMAHRVKKDGTWGAWIGSASDKTVAALWSHYGTGSTPDYKIYIYALGNRPESAPETGLTVAEVSALEGWKDYPNTSGQWWQCIGHVDGVTDTVSSWSEIIPVNGQDGVAQDGKYTEFRFAKNASTTEPPTLNKELRTPTGWDKDSGSIKLETGEYLWMTTAVINPDNTLSASWTTPVRISGEQGPGVTKVIEYYAKGTSATAAPTTGWTETVPTLSVGEYLWNYEEVYVSGASTPLFTSPKAMIGSYSKDGKGIKSVTEYYCKLTNGDIKNVPAKGSDLWLTTAPVLDATYRYLWNYEKITYSDDTTSTTDPVVIGVYGDKGNKGDKGDKGDDGLPGADGAIGPKGAKLRMTTYSTYGPNGTASSKTNYLSGKGDGEEFYDIVIYETSAGKHELYLCNVTHVGGTALPTNTSYWTKAAYWDFAATKLLLAEKISADMIDVDSLMAAEAFIKNLQVSKLHAVDGNSTVDVNVNGINQSYSDGAGHVMGLVSNKDYLRYRSYYTESGNTVTCEPLWIMKDGSGSLANGNISWTADGKIKADTYTPDYYSDDSSSWVLPKIPVGYSKDFTIQYVYASRTIYIYDFTCDDSKSQIIYVWKDGTTAIKTNNGSWMQGTTNLGSGITPSMTDDNRAGIGFIHCYGHYSSYSGTVWHLVEDSSMAMDDSSSSGSSSTSGYTGLVSIFDKFDTGHYFTFTNGILTGYDAEYNNQ